MLTVTPDHSRYDLHLRVLGVSVRVHPTFWLTTGALAWGMTIADGIQYLPIVIAYFFVAVLMHESGHVCMGRIFGLHGHIVFYGLGGVTIGSDQLRRRWQR